MQFHQMRYSPGSLKIESIKDLKSSIDSNSVSHHSPSLYVGIFYTSITLAITYLADTKQ